jgi:hypothetical protein
MRPDPLLKTDKCTIAVERAPEGTGIGLIVQISPKAAVPPSENWIRSSICLSFFTPASYINAKLIDWGTFTLRIGFFL